MPNMNNSSNESFTRKLLNVNANNDVNEKKINTKNRGGIVAYIDKVLRDGINTTLDFVVPHARKDPLNPMAYVRDVNEWFLPSAQMALDELEGRESYPKWSYLLASLPVVGKVGKPITKPISKAMKGRKALGRIVEDYDNIKITAPNEVDLDHLAEVSKEMDEIGRPVIRVAYDPAYDTYIAFEGSHRLKAAHDKGVKPILDEVDINDVYNGKYSLDELSDDLDISDLEQWLDNTYRRINNGLEYKFE